MRKCRVALGHVLARRLSRCANKRGFGNACECGRLLRLCVQNPSAHLVNLKTNQIPVPPEMYRTLTKCEPTDQDGSGAGPHRFSSFVTFWTGQVFDIRKGLCSFNQVDVGHLASPNWSVRIHRCCLFYFCPIPPKGRHRTIRCEGVA
jgi:hypothetical protein